LREQRRAIRLNRERVVPIYWFVQRQRTDASKLLENRGVMGRVMVDKPAGSAAEPRYLTKYEIIA